MTPARGRARTPPLVLGIESSCDETSVALLDGDGRILSSLVASQFGAHELYGGVVPEIAARAHLANLPPLLTRALSEAGAGLSDVGLGAAPAGGRPLAGPPLAVPAGGWAP